MKERNEKKKTNWRAPGRQKERTPRACAKFVLQKPVVVFVTCWLSGKLVLRHEVPDEQSEEDRISVSIQNYALGLTTRLGRWQLCAADLYELLIFITAAPSCFLFFGQLV